MQAFENELPIAHEVKPVFRRTTLDEERQTLIREKIARAKAQAPWPPGIQNRRIHMTLCVYPLKGGSEVQRPARFAEHLASYGWSPLRYAE